MQHKRREPAILTYLYRKEAATGEGFYNYHKEEPGENTKQETLDKIELHKEKLLLDNQTEYKPPQCVAYKVHVSPRNPHRSLWFSSGQKRSQKKWHIWKMRDILVSQPPAWAYAKCADDAGYEVEYEIG